MTTPTTHECVPKRIKDPEYLGVGAVVTRCAICGVKMADQTPVHACPPEGESLAPCCGRTPFEIPMTDRMTLDPELVTCGRDSDGGE